MDTQDLEDAHPRLRGKYYRRKAEMEEWARLAEEEEREERRIRELQDESIAGHLLKEIERARERREEMTKEWERDEAERVERIRAAIMRKRQGLAGAAA